MIAVEDIGHYGLAAFERRDELANSAIDIAGDALTGPHRQVYVEEDRPAVVAGGHPLQLERHIATSTTGFPLPACGERVRVRGRGRRRRRSVWLPLTPTLSPR